MQQVAELDAQANRVDLRASRKRKASPRRKVTVRLSEGVCGRLDVAADRPGVAKSLLVEVALEHFLNPVPSVEALVRDRLDDIHARFDQLERDMRMIAETVALPPRLPGRVVHGLDRARIGAAAARSVVPVHEDELRMLAARRLDNRARHAVADKHARSLLSALPLHPIRRHDEGDDVELRASALGPTQDVMAGVLVPEQSRYDRRLLRSRIWRWTSGIF